jgi:menaquinol-cytochrome c reductase iron-sulfur subunit
MDDHGNSPPSPDRRNLLVKTAAIVIGGIITVVPPIAGLTVLLDPLRRTSAARGMVRVGSISALPANGEPRKLPVLDTEIDAWNVTPNVPVGSVYIEKTGPKTVRVLNATCPHLGCSVSFSATIGHFFCPCHKSSFNLDGSILDPKSPSPRGMDSLQSEVRGDGEVWVKFQNFRKGIPEKIAL